MSAGGTEEVGRADSAVEVLRHRQAVEARIRRWFPGTVAAHTVYRHLAGAGTRPGDRVLHLGAGYDSLRTLSALNAGSVIALDLDAEALARHPCPRRVVGDAAALPFRSGSIELIACEHVFEHLERPGKVLVECARALRVSGRLVFMTPNRFSYVSLAATLTPQWFHVWYRSRLTGASSAADTFPTYFRLNTPGRIRRAGQRAGLVLDSITTVVGWPTYLERSEWLHRIGVVVHWLLERGPSIFHISIVGTLVKKVP